MKRNEFVHLRNKLALLPKDKFNFSVNIECKFEKKGCASEARVYLPHIGNKECFKFVSNSTK
jgi:hypothetical protein